MVGMAESRSESRIDLSVLCCLEQVTSKQLTCGPFELQVTESVFRVFHCSLMQTLFKGQVVCSLHQQQTLCYNFIVQLLYFMGFSAIFRFMVYLFDYAFYFLTVSHFVHLRPSKKELS